MYRYNVKTGEWAHLTRFTKFPTRMWLSNIYKGGVVAPNPEVLVKTPNLNEIIESVMDEVKKLDLELKKKASKFSKIQSGNGNNNGNSNGNNSQVFDSGSGEALFEKLRWFAMHSDISNTRDIDGKTCTNPVDPSEWVDRYTNQNQTQNIAMDTATGTVPKLHVFESPEDVLNLTTTYAHIRDKKLSAHHCSLTDNEISAINKRKRLPRYVENGLGLQGGGNGNINGNGKNKIPLTVTDRTDNVVQLVANKEEETTIPNSDRNLTKSKSSTSNSKLEVAATDELICTDGSCFIMRNTIPESSVIVAGSDIKNELSTQSESQSTSASQPKKILPIVPPKKMMKLVGQALQDWNMIEDGDRILLGLSGGKDSLSMLHTLIAFQVSSNAVQCMCVYIPVCLYISIG